jgi:hypothetical protein
MKQSHHAFLKYERMIGYNISYIIMSIIINHFAKLQLKGHSTPTIQYSPLCLLVNNKALEISSVISHKKTRIIIQNNDHLYYACLSRNQQSLLPYHPAESHVSNNCVYYWMIKLTIEFDKKIHYLLHDQFNQSTTSRLVPLYLIIIAIIKCCFHIR